jgi:HEAT repeat protein
VEAGPSLQAALNNPRFAARIEAAVALWKTTGKTEEPLAVLLHEVGRPHAPWDAASAFGEFGAYAAPAVPRLRQLLRDERAETRLFVAIALGKVGTAARAAVPDLKALLDDEDEDVQEAAAQAIAAIAGRSDT